MIENGKFLVENRIRKKYDELRKDSQPYLKCDIPIKERLNDCFKQAFRLGQLGIDSNSSIMKMNEFMISDISDELSATLELQFDRLAIYKKLILNRQDLIDAGYYFIEEKNGIYQLYSKAVKKGNPDAKLYGTLKWSSAAGLRGAGGPKGNSRYWMYDICDESFFHVRGSGIETNHLKIPSHILIWFWCNNRWPDPGYVIEHADGNSQNNRIDNLDHVNQRTNATRAPLQRKLLKNPDYKLLDGEPDYDKIRKKVREVYPADGSIKNIWETEKQRNEGSLESFF